MLIYISFKGVQNVFLKDILAFILSILISIKNFCLEENKNEKKIVKKNREKKS